MGSSTWQWCDTVLLGELDACWKLLSFPEHRPVKTSMCYNTLLQIGHMHCMGCYRTQVSGVKNEHTIQKHESDRMW